MTPVARLSMQKSADWRHQCRLYYVSWVDAKNDTHSMAEMACQYGERLL